MLRLFRASRLRGTPRRNDRLQGHVTGRRPLLLESLEPRRMLATLYVDLDATGEGSGGGWDDAYTDLQAALGAAGSGDEIWVAEGTYTPTEADGDQAISFNLKSEVNIYGGFDGSESTREERDWTAHVTVLSGDLNGDDASGGDNSENSYHVVYASGVTNAILDGFTITAGNANGPYPEIRGGGMYNVGASSPTVANVTFNGNLADAGGAMYNRESSSPTLANVTFSNNSASGGGAMYNHGSSSPTLTNVTFIGNSATSDDGNPASRHSGGAMYNYESSPILTGVTFINNSADDYGGGILNWIDSSPTLTDVTFDGNSADIAGGIYTYASSPVLTNVIFSNNSASTIGGGMHNYKSPATLTNVIFLGNFSERGGGMCNQVSSPTLANVTFSGNVANVSGGGMYSSGTCSPTLVNSILWGNTAPSAPALLDSAGSVSSVTYSIVRGGWAGDGNLDADPRFVRLPDAGDDGEWVTEDDDYGDLHLQSDSPAIDTGNNVAVPDDTADLDDDGITAEPTPLDLDMQPRFVGTPPIVDMGAYEFWNHPPIAHAGGPYTIDEGQDLVLDGSGSTDPGGDALTYHWDLDDDGQYDDAEGSTPTVPWTTLASLGLASDGMTLSVGVQVDDGEGGTDTAGTGLVINNVAPTAEAGGPYTIDEGQDLMLDGSGSTDPGGDTLTYHWDLDGDGEHDDAEGSTPTVPWTTLASLGLASDGMTLSVGVQVDDGEGGIDTAGPGLVINNVAPTAEASGPYTIDEGQDLVLDGSGSTDPGGDALIYTWDLDGDGEYDDAEGSTPTVPWTTLASLGLASDGMTLSVGVQVDDGEGGIDTVGTGLVINNVSPTADAGDPYTIDEGQDLVLDGSGSTDPGGDALIYTWDLDGDGEYDDAEGATPTVPWATLASLGLASDGTTLSIGVHVDDGEGGTDTAGTGLVISDVAPTADAGGPYTINEGLDLVLDGSGSTDPGGDALTYHWDLDDDGQYDDAEGATPTVPWTTLASLGLASDGTTLSIGIQVDDGEGGIDTAATTLAIINVAPTADIGGPYTVVEGGTVQLDASGSTDPGGDALSYAWDFDNDGQFDDATGATPDFSAAGLYGPVTATVGVRVTDDDGDIDTDTVDIVIAEPEPIDLGSVDFTVLSGLDLTKRSVWYQLTAARSGLLTAIGAESTTVNLYDSSKTVAMAVSVTADGVQRLDYAVVGGETYYVRIAGGSGDAELTIANLVTTTGTEVQVFGTGGADTFEFAPTGSYAVTINGIGYDFDEAQYDTVVFSGGEGADSAFLTGGPDGEIARFFPDHGTFGENAFLVTVNEVTAITAHGGGGLDEAYLYDSPGDDEFVSRMGYGKLSGDGFSLETFDFMYNYGYATTREGGSDAAYMEDTPTADKFKFDWPKSGQFFGKMYGGGVYYNRAKNFEQIVATMTEGKNTVRLFDSEGNDTFYGQKDEGRMVGTGFDVTVSGYGQLAAYASTGLDIAYLEDSDDDDTTRARPHKIVLWGGDDNDPTYELMARRFDEYHFEGTHAGFDRAKLHDTALNDYAEAIGDSASLYSNDGTPDLLYEVVAFEWVKLYATENGSQDTLNKEDPLDFELVYDPAVWDELP